MSGELRLVVILALAILFVLVVLWALFGPRRPSDESGHHVELARRTRERDAERRRRQWHASGNGRDEDDT